MHWRGERGAGSILAVALVTAVLTLCLLSLPLYTVLAAKQRIAGAADASALAAADAAVGRARGIPCELAADVARANRTVLAGCQADGLVFTVLVEAVVLGFAVRASATAGPPDLRTSDSVVLHTRMTAHAV